MKKIIAITLAAFCILGILAGCSNQTPTQTGEQPTNVNQQNNTQDTPPIEDTPQVKSYPCTIVIEKKYSERFQCDVYYPYLCCDELTWGDFFQISQEEIDNEKALCEAAGIEWKCSHDIHEKMKLNIAWHIEDVGTTSDENNDGCIRDLSQFKYKLLNAKQNNEILISRGFTVIQYGQKNKTLFRIALTWEEKYTGPIQSDVCLFRITEIIDNTAE